MFVSDIAVYTWEIIRLRRCKAAIINSRCLPALKSLLEQLLRDRNQYGSEVEESAEKIARRWFKSTKVKEKMVRLLADFSLDETAIEAEAIRQSAEDLERIERVLASLEWRRAKALASIGEYRSTLCQQLRNSSNRLIENKAALVDQTAGS